ncbi:MAG: adenylate/guanylate cyclase domain-containing protein [Gemmatimonadota bacterium]
MELTRRLAAVWFADIVGFTRLSSQDEGAALRLVGLLQEAARQEIDRHGGTLVKFMGDGVLAYAGSTASAIETVLTLRERFHELCATDGRPSFLRIGVHVGDVVVSPDGDVYGDGVNVASRLQREAGAGRVMVSEDVWRQCRQRPDLEFAPLGTRALEGLDEPVWVYEVAPPSETPVPESGTSAREGGERARSLAVLPFEVVGQSGDAAILASGLHSDLLTELSKVPALTVISRTSVMGYRDTSKPVPRIARELNVGTIIEGSVQSAGNRIRLNVQVIDGVRDIHRWAEHYDRELTTENLFAIQTELTQRIVESLHAELAPRQVAANAGPPTADLHAYRLAVEGRMQFDLKTEAGFLRAIELFEEAVELDPSFGLAWVGLADSLALMEDYGYGDGEALLSRADKAVRRALELVPDSAEAHTSLGLLLLTHQDAPGAFREFERAIQLQPGYADAYTWHCWLSLVVGRGDVARKSAEQAVELNPVSAEAVSNFSHSCIAVGDLEKALVEARRAGTLSPSYTTPVFYEGITLYELGRFAEARSVLAPLSFAAAGELTVPWAGLGPDATLALAHIGDGDSDAARTILGEIDPAVFPFAAGVVHAALGEIEPALEAFRSVGEMSAWPSLAIHHYHRSVWLRVREDPRFENLLDVAYRSWRMQPPRGAAA